MKSTSALGGPKDLNGWKLVPIEFIEATKVSLYRAMLVERLLNTHKRHKSGRCLDPAFAAL
jgi:hypothetical protein